MPFEQGEKITIVVTDTSEERELCDNSVEFIRKCSQQDTTNTSWDRSFISSHENKDKDYNMTPPFVSIMATDDLSSTLGNITNSSTQTEPFVSLPVNCSFVDVSLSFSKDFKIQDTTSNETSEQSIRFKRCRRSSSEGDHKELRPWKKQCSASCSSSTSDLTDAHLELDSTSCLSSNSDVSFKSIHSNHSIKVRKGHMKSESKLFRHALQRSWKTTTSFSKRHENASPGGTPRKERSYRRNSKLKAWGILDLCAWIGRKGYQSLTGLYSDILHEPLVHQENNECAEELRELRRFLEVVDKKQERLVQENESLKEGMKMMMEKMEQLEGKLRKCNSPSKPKPQAPPPPPPPPPPPLPPPTDPPVTKLPIRSHTLPRCGSAPPRVPGPHLTITPQDIANVKLRKTRDNPVRSKSNQKQPLVTQQLLQNTRAKLGRARPVAASTPKQQLNELEKCLLQESTVTSLYRRRVARNTFRSAEELRPRPYPAARCSRSPLSPRSPRANSLPRVKPTMSPLKFPNGTAPNSAKLNKC